MRFFAVALSLVVFGCSQQADKNVPAADSAAEKSVAVKPVDPCTTIYAPPTVIIPKTLTGDFDGDEKKEKLLEKLISRKRNEEIKTLIEYRDWDCFVQYVIGLEPILYMIAESGSLDTLRLSEKNNMQVLNISKIFNLGDMTGNGSDEIAMVVSSADFSLHAKMRVYSYDSKKWELIHCFSVHETGIDSVNSNVTGIPGVLEKRKGKWYYYDYIEMDYDNPDDVGKMKLLKITGCNY